jgi:hypothetical protein
MSAVVALVLSMMFGVVSLLSAGAPHQAEAEAGLGSGCKAAAEGTGEEL